MKTHTPHPAGHTKNNSDPDAPTRTGCAQPFPQRYPYHRLSLSLVCALAATIMMPGTAHSAAGEPVVFPDIIKPIPPQARPSYPGNVAILLENTLGGISGLANLELQPRTIAGTGMSQPYNITKTYQGLFDPKKCYIYNYHTNESERHFAPVRFTTDNRCRAADAPWSGNWLNWATTRSLDVVSKTLMGGHRVKDTPTETWIETTWSADPTVDQRQTPSWFEMPSATYTPNLENRLLGASRPEGDLLDSTPFSLGSLGLFDGLFFGSYGLGNRFRFSMNSSINPFPFNDYLYIRPYTLTGGGVELPRTIREPINFRSSTETPCTDPVKPCEVTLRVKVCVPGLLESNCVQYSNGWKPEGVMQKYSDKFNFSLFSYLAVGLSTRHGAVMRSPMKSIAPYIADSTGQLVSNPAKEWDPVTGVLIANPDSSIAEKTSLETGIEVNRSGIINAIGQPVPTGSYPSRASPLAELYYAASRYYRGLGNVASWSDLSTIPETMDVAAGVSRASAIGSYPIVTEWGDPISLWCQPNFILGFASNENNFDFKVPGAEPLRLPHGGPAYLPLPSEIDTDDIDAAELTRTVSGMESDVDLDQIPFYFGQVTVGTNSPYVVGLSWDLRSRNIRPDLPGKGSHVSTFWVDLGSYLSLRGWELNLLALSAKYGGAKLPEDFDADAWGNDSLPDSFWKTTQDTVQPFGRSSRTNWRTTPDFPRPDNYFPATSANKMQSAVDKAFEEMAKQSQVGSGISLAANSTQLNEGTRSFQAQFASGSWAGDLLAFSVDENTGKLSTAPLWRAAEKLPVWSERKIFFHHPTGISGEHHIAFNNFSTLTDAQKTALGNADVMNYIRGDVSKERRNGGGFRNRAALLGDIVHSQPVYVGAPDPLLYRRAAFTGAGAYAAFAKSKADRKGVVYVGANDGMLHGFDANTGVELYAFIPNRVILNGLKDLSNPAYDHRYFVDGELTVADVYLGSTKGWRTVLVGTLGRGGPGLFALDVTDPANISLLWEKGPADIPALGRNLGKPVIAQVADAQWRVILGNGPDSTARKPQLVMVNIGTGAVSVIDTGEAGGNNGLSAVFTWDASNNGFIDTVYAGDLLGNLWRFKLAGTGSSAKLFTALGPDNKPQPITSAPLVGLQPGTQKTWVFFGTGRFLTRDDLQVKDIQTWYGMMDEGSQIAGRAALTKREILAEGIVGNFMARAIEEGSPGDMSGKKGWYIDLVSPPDNLARGERMVSLNLFRGNVLVGTTRIPDPSDPCEPEGVGFVMAINPFTGGRLDRHFFDFTADGAFTDADKISITTDAGAVLVFASGIGMPASPNRPIFIADVMQISLDDGNVVTLRTQGPASELRRTSWREVIGN